MEKERKANILENCKCQQVNMAKNTGDKQRSPRSQPLLTAFARCDKAENFLIHGELTEANKAVERPEIEHNRKLHATIKHKTSFMRCVQISYVLASISNTSTQRCHMAENVKNSGNEG